MREVNVSCIQRWANNATTQLAADISPTDTQIPITPGSGSKFPDLSGNQFFLITVVNNDTCSFEIMKVIQKSDDSFTVIRGQENTVPQPFPKGSLIELRLTAGTLEKLRNLGLCCIEFVHIQAEPQTVWEIKHNLGCYPAVLTFNEKDEIIIGEIKYPDENTILVNFSTPIAGKAILTSSDLSVRDKILGIEKNVMLLSLKYDSLMRKLNELICSLENFLSIFREENNFSPEKLLEKLKLVDGPGSGLDADTLDGRHGNEFALADLSNVDLDKLRTLLENITIVCGGGEGGDFVKTDLSNLDRQLLKQIILAIDGPGSKIDADLLDGKEGNEYLLKDLSNLNLEALVDLLSRYGNLVGVSADMLDNHHASDFALNDLSNVSNDDFLAKLQAVGYSGGGGGGSGNVDLSLYALKNLSNVEPSDIVVRLNSANPGNGLDSDMVDGLHADSFLRRDITSTPINDNVIELGSSDKKFKTIYATTFDGTALKAKYADIAEIYSVPDDLTPGTVVKVDPTGKFDCIPVDKIASNEVIGVISENPGVLIGSDKKGKPVALKGRVKCRVVGPVKRGDVLVSYKNGTAVSIRNIKIEEKTPAAVRVGIALESSDDPSEKLIEIII